MKFLDAEGMGVLLAAIPFAIFFMFLCFIS